MAIDVVHNNIWNLTETRKSEKGTFLKFVCRFPVEMMLSEVKKVIEMTEKLYDKLFPALEPLPGIQKTTPESLKTTLRDPKERGRNVVKYLVDSPNGSEKLPEVLDALGYKIKYIEKEGKTWITVKFPDQQTFLARWQKYSNDHPELKLPPFNLIESDGIAGDWDFVKAYLDADGLLSTQEEFVHDHTVHIIPIVDQVLQEALTGKSLEIKECVKESLYEPIEWSKKQHLSFPYNVFEAFVGAFVDTISAYDYRSLRQIFNGKRIDKTLQMFYMCHDIVNANEQWKAYFTKRFNLSPSELARCLRDFYKMISLCYASKLEIDPKIVDEIFDRGMCSEANIAYGFYLLFVKGSYDQQDIQLLKQKPYPGSEIRLIHDNFFSQTE